MFPGGALIGGPQLTGIDPTGDLASLGRDACDLIRIPDVGPQLAVNELEFIQFIDGVDLPRASMHAHAAHNIELGGIDHANRGRAIAQIQVLTIVGQPPPFTE